jgi:hypothetical protein
MKRDREAIEDESTEKGPSLAELIESRRFLGREFLVWLWFESELFESQFAIEGFGEATLWLERSLTLESALTESTREKEKSKLTGVAPSGRPEAREALRQGKLPTQARVVLERGEDHFAFVFDAEALALSGVKIPAVVKGEGEGPFYDRIQRIEELERAIEALYRDFLLLRLDHAWDDLVLPAIASWANEREDQALARYRAQRPRDGSTPGETGRTSQTLARKKKPAA